MIKRGIAFVLIFYILTTVFQWLFRPEIRWAENAGLSTLAFFTYIFIEWISKSQKYKKNDK